jgi:hypothetical protein
MRPAHSPTFAARLMVRGNPHFCADALGTSIRHSRSFLQILLSFTWVESEVNIRYAIDKQRRLILTTAEGRVTFDDVRDHQGRLLADPDFDASFDQLIDATAATKFEISADQARILAKRCIFSPKSRRAFVATEPHIFGLGRMMEIYREGLEYADVHVFYSMDEALKWLERVEREKEKSWSG